MIKILCISGSLRNNSSTHVILNEIVRYQIDRVEFIVFNNLGKLPHFDDNAETSIEVTRFREALKNADGVLFVTPEYAFGAPGTLKNALDWTVSSGEFVGKPTAVVVGATGGENAYHSLLLTLKAISANIGERSTLLISFIRAKINQAGVTDQELKISLLTVVEDLIENIGRKSS
jgi:chromate reductase, NAD(P)H dehydrogenase (quinone)